MIGELIKVIRNNPEIVKQAMKNRQMNLDNEIDEILKRKGFEMVENYQLNDWYFSKFDNVLNL